MNLSNYRKTIEDGTTTYSPIRGPLELFVTTDEGHFEDRSGKFHRGFLARTWKCEWNDASYINRSVHDILMEANRKLKEENATLKERVARLESDTSF